MGASGLRNSCASSERNSPLGASWLDAGCSFFRADICAIPFVPLEASQCSALFFPSSTNLLFHLDNFFRRRHASSAELESPPDEIGNSTVQHISDAPTPTTRADPPAATARQELKKAAHGFRHVVD